MAKVQSKSKNAEIMKTRRDAAFAQTLNSGVSDGYLKYLKSESKENRLIEKYL